MRKVIQDLQIVHERSDFLDWLVSNLLDKFYLNSLSPAASLASSLGCKIGSLPFTYYLGFKLGISPKRVIAWSPIVEKFRKKLALWQAKLISFGGRITLVKSSLASLPLFLMSLFKAVLHHLS